MDIKMEEVDVKKITLENNLYYQKNLLLYYRIEYPQFYSSKYQNNLIKINRYYKDKAIEELQNCVDAIFKYAIELFEFSKERNIPVRQFKLYYLYYLTYNKDCTLSLYYDNYVYLGGAHGLTTRSSDTWDIQIGQITMLCNLFKTKINYYDYIYKSIISQIENQIKNNEIVLYFPNYKENVYLKLDVNNYYLRDSGIVIFFQQYDIAPYAAGIPEFLIPYDTEVMTLPYCK